MYILMVAVFIFGYLAIALEHNIRIDKAATALVTGVLLWSIFVMKGEEVLKVEPTQTLTEFVSPGHVESIENKDLKKYIVKETYDLQTEKVQEFKESNHSVPETINHFITHSLQHHLIEIAEILFFLIGAMTIVELIDAHEGFAIITDKIKTSKKVPLLWILSLLTFFFSAALDNLTTAIVMSALLKKLIGDKNDLWLFAGVIIIAANAGGAWSPIGDVTTIMLWIGGQITAGAVVTTVIAPSLVALLVPLIILTFTMKGSVTRPVDVDEHEEELTTNSERMTVFILGVLSLLFVPVYKTVTHMPPFMGVLLGLGVMWTLTEILHRKKSIRAKSKLSVIAVLKKVDIASVLFFMGILLAVGSLQVAGHLVGMAKILEEQIGDIYVINMVIGVLSSIVDNVPLVKAAMGMYEIGPEAAGVAYPVDHTFWRFLAYCAGTGGSCLIIGSAAGVAVMGILKIDFMWYMKRISLLALAGYLAGAGVYILQG